MGSGKEGSQRGKKEGLNPRAAQPAASPANPAANLTLPRTGSGPHSIAHSRAAPGQLGSATPMAPKGTEEEVRDTHSALLAHHLMLAGDSRSRSPSAVRAPSPARSSALRGAPRSTPAPPPAWHGGGSGRCLGRFGGCREGRRRGSCKLLEFGKRCSPELASGGGSPGDPGGQPRGSGTGAAVPCPCKGGVGAAPWGPNLPQDNQPAPIPHQPAGTRGGSGRQLKRV